MGPWMAQCSKSQCDPAFAVPQSGLCGKSRYGDGPDQVCVD